MVIASYVEQRTKNTKSRVPTSAKPDLSLNDKELKEKIRINQRI